MNWTLLSNIISLHVQRHNVFSKHIYNPNFILNPWFSAESSLAALKCLQNRFFPSMLMSSTQSSSFSAFADSLLHVCCIIATAHHWKIIKQEVDHNKSSEPFYLWNPRLVCILHMHAWMNALVNKKQTKTRDFSQRPSFMVDKNQST